MRIGLVTDEYPPARITGGIGAYTVYQARLLAAAGHEVHVFCQADGLAKEEPGIWIHPVSLLEAPTRMLRYVYYRTLGLLLGPLQRRARWGLAVGRAIRRVERDRGPFDAVEVPEAGGYAGFVRRGGVRGPLVVRLHIGNELLARLGAGDDGRWHPVMARLERWSVRAADLVTAPSRAVVAAQAADLALEPARVRVYPNPCPQRVPSERELPARESQLLLTVGKLCRLKGADLVLEAYARLRERWPGLQLVMIGRDELATEERRLAESLGLAAAGALPGELPAAQVQLWLQRATIVVVASRFESFSLVTVEAMRAGALVIAADAGALPELVAHERTGLLFACGDAAALAAQIERALQGPGEARAWAAAGHEWAAHVTQDEAVRQAACAAYVTAGELAAQRRGAAGGRA